MLLSEHYEMFGIFSPEDEPYRLPLDTKMNPQIDPQIQLWNRPMMRWSVWCACLLPPCNLHQKFLDTES